MGAAWPVHDCQCGGVLFRRHVCTAAFSPSQAPSGGKGPIRVTVKPASEAAAGDGLRPPLPRAGRQLLLRLLRVSLPVSASDTWSTVIMMII
jgi:hypothetical protein